MTLIVTVSESSWDLASSCGKLFLCVRRLRMGRDEDIYFLELGIF